MSTLIEHELSSIAPTKATVVTIGMFDGLHMGHQALIRHLVEQAHRKNALGVVVTFKQHPTALLTPYETVPSLVSLDKRIHLIKSMSVDLIIPLTFSAELAMLRAQPFVETLQRDLKMQGLILGWDFALGHQREGSLDTLHDLGQQMDFSTEVVGPVKYQGSIVSSTAIRQALSLGDIATANAMLTRPFCLDGTIVSGDGRGAKLGFPTANLSVHPQQVLPADGVYATCAALEGQMLPAATFIGTRPTFNGITRIVEVHLLDFNGNLYNRSLKIDIIERLRGVQKFPDAQALKSQISLDIAQIRRILSVHNCCVDPEKS